MSGRPRFCLLVVILYLVVITATYYPLCKWMNPCTSASSSSSVLTSLEQMLCCSWNIPIIKSTPFKHIDPRDQQHGQTVILYTNATSKHRNGESQVPSRDSNVTLQNRKHNQQQQKHKVILFWTSFFGVQDYGFGFGHEPFNKHNCPVTNCVTTNDKALLKQASAIVFHNRDVASKTVFPSPRFTNQSYVFFLMESPPHQGIGLTRFKGVYNLTMTYRRDSDIQIPYGGFESGSSAIPDKQVTKIVAGKKKLVAWFVSNCHATSERELYVKELQKHIGVDIYGACGPLQCPKGGPKSKECDVMLERDYKFYIAFENSVCKDYVTEKFFRAMGRYVVPVVYGGGNYSAIAPPHSVINARDYASPKHLADYLHVLAADDTQYTKYFEWKHQYHVSRKSGFCKLCEIINAPDAPPKIYHDLHKWWNTDAKCENNFIHKLIH